MPKRFGLFLIKTYQVFLRPYFGNACKYHPTCSQYAQQAVAQKGLLKGSWLTFKRILRCHPFAEGGWDPIPNNEVNNAGQ